MVSARRDFLAGRGLHLAVVAADSGRLIGGVGLRDLSWVHRHGELTYWFGQPFWGQGFASEAVEKLLDVGFGPLRLHRVEAGAFAENRRSQGVLRKAGFRPEGARREAFRVDGRWKEDRMFGLTVDDWRARTRR